MRELQCSGGLDGAAIGSRMPSGPAAFGGASRDVAKPNPYTPKHGRGDSTK